MEANARTVHPPTPARLELRPVGGIVGEFRVPRYQRGYRWGSVEVDLLLDDIAASGGEPYILQPIVVRMLSPGTYELIDGQQRLTTLYLLYRHLRDGPLPDLEPPYSIAYETRPGSACYLRHLDAERADDNIDYRHLFDAFDRIGAWFERHGEARDEVARRLRRYLDDSVRFIWYEVPADTDAAFDSTTVFTRLNAGRIPLTDAELFKATLLAGSDGAPGETSRAHEIAAQWDRIERDLQRPNLWAFVAGDDGRDRPTRIGLLLDTLAGKPPVADRSPFHTFDCLRGRLAEESLDTVWNDVVDMHELVLGWYEDRDLYHRIGYLVSTPKCSLEHLVELARKSTKRDFDNALDTLVRDSLNLTPSTLRELAYDMDKDKCSEVLFLMNVETVRWLRGSSERYPFAEHASGAWSLEHIHAQNAEDLTKAEQWTAWLRAHRDVLDTFPHVGPAQRDELLREMDVVLTTPNGKDFQRVASKVERLFSPDGGSVHGLENLALLSRGHNSALGNAVFEVKRRTILATDRKGGYIPPCTRRVFLKYYTAADAQQIHFWGPQDRTSYLDAMLDAGNGGIGHYLRTESDS